MKTKFVKWAGLGLGTAVLGVGLAACSPGGEGEGEGHSSGEAGVIASGELGEGEAANGEAGEGGEHAHSVDTLPLPNRLAFMSGHVEAGLALYRAGELQMAAPHLLHPVSETHQAERAGLEQLGFKASLFEEVSTALEDGRQAAEIGAQLLAAEKNLAEVTSKAGGEPAEIISYLMSVIVEEYTIAITDGVVSDAGEYQDAYGFAIVAKKHAEKLKYGNSSLMEEINALIALWPEAPIPPEQPSSIAQVIAQTSKVELALSQ
ncbi:hypothetical protein [Hirschia maritima]|uniref:hypothetical protein n=1 Tax=Hirschia maritima TaxID=1121961 RepID=UPI00037E9A98|nr:hypothetical protein [Hirschia maritima]